MNPGESKLLSCIPFQPPTHQCLQGGSGPGPPDARRILITPNIGLYKDYVGGIYGLCRGLYWENGK